MELIDQIKEKYPHPTSSNSPITYSIETRECNAYCVGGAFLNYIYNMKYYYHYPNFRLLAKALEEQNPSLDKSKSISLAMRIINYNDAELFNLAWQELERALSYRGEEKNLPISNEFIVNRKEQ